MQFTKLLAAVSAFLATGTLSGSVYINITNTDINYLESASVSYANYSLYIGEIKFQIYAEQYSVPNTGGTYFTSYHQVPTGGQSLYIFPNGTKPVGLTVPHSGYIAPEGASIAGLDFNGPDDVLAYNGENKFIGCQVDATTAALNSYQIYWAGAEVPADWNCTDVLTIHQSGAC